MSSPYFRPGPVFPAMTLGKSPLNHFPDSYSDSYRFFNNGTTISRFDCINHIQICDIVEDKRWFRAPSTPWWLLRHRHLWEDSSNTDAALLLLEASLASSYTIARGALDAQSRCSEWACDYLPDDQWRIEVRRWFEASLATIQVLLLDIVRPSQHIGSWYLIPHEYREICKLGKFRSTGWRNVNFVGFLGLLILAGCISLASCKTEEGDLWIVIASRAIWRSLRYLVHFLKAAIQSFLRLGAALSQDLLQSIRQCHG